MEDIQSKEYKEERRKNRNDKFASHLFNLSQLTYTALVLGSILIFFQNMRLTLSIGLMLVLGGLIAIGFSSWAYLILKK